MFGISVEEKEKIIALCRAIVPDATIWLYGSRARGDYKDRSDIDLALDAGHPIGFSVIEELKSVLAASDLMYSFDIVDYNAIRNEEFKKAITKERVLWIN